MAFVGCGESEANIWTANRFGEMEDRESERVNESELSKQQIVMQMIILYIAVQNLNSYFILKIKYRKRIVQFPQ